jgi:23S rRNA (pseudouridine1915-N3)-methyltransferase
MRFRFIWIGKTKDKNWRALQEDYLQRLSHFVKFEITEIRESAARETKEIEGKRILAAVTSKPFIILLDVKGKLVNSPELAGNVENWQNRSLREIAFIIGGQDGVSQEIVDRADFCLSLSPLTLTHEASRVILIEQLYRAFTIICNYPYQK